VKLEMSIIYKIIQIWFRK